MPELPEIESLKSYFNHTALHKKIVNVDVRDDAVLKSISSRSFQMRLKDETFKSSSRHGKYLFVELDRDETLVIHFGMTGDLKNYKSTVDDPQYAKVIFDLENGYKLAFICPRKFGSLRLADSKEKFIKDHELGPDAYSDFDWNGFKKMISSRRGSIKTTLMNQKVIAGIGNDYSDEILFQAKIYPFTKIIDLEEEKLKEIWKQLQKVLKKTINRHAEKDKYPSNFLYTHREDGAECPICGGTIKRRKFSGRSSYYCQKHQNKT